MSIMDSLKSGVNSALDSLNPVLDFGYGIYREWMAVNGTKTLTGSRVIIKISGKPVGLVQHITINAQIEQQRLYGIGDMLPAEIVAGEIVYTVEGSRALIPKKTLTALGLLVEDEDFSTAPGLELELIDKITESNIVITGCKFTNYRIEASKHNIVLEHFAMTARSMTRRKWGKTT